MPKRYSPDFRQRALRMLEEATPDHVNDSAAITHVAGWLGVAPETLRKWRQRYLVEPSERPRPSREELVEIKALKREVAELKRANEILKTASAFFAAELDRPTPR